MMDFYRISEVLVANRSLEEYFAMSEKPPYFIALVFLKDLPHLPEIGLSLLSGQDLVSYRIKPNESIKYFEWHTLIHESFEIKTYQYIFIRVYFNQGAVALQLYAQCNSRDSFTHHYTYPFGFSNVFLAIASPLLFDSLDRCSIALLDGVTFNELFLLEDGKNIQKFDPSHLNCRTLQDLLQKQELKYQHGNYPYVNHTEITFENLQLENKLESINLKTKKEIDKSSKKKVWEAIYTDDEEEGEDDEEEINVKETENNGSFKTLCDKNLDELKEQEYEKLLCVICQEKQIEIMLHPCGHAALCQQCYLHYTETEQRNSTVNSLKETNYLLCPLCRENVVGHGRIWINTTKCLICGCKTLNAVAAGKGGCGCLIGCYDKAIQVLKNGGRCPYCFEKIVGIIKVFIGNFIN